MKNNNNAFTRGDGLLEGLLAKLRAKRANELIPDKSRKGNILDIGCGTYPYFLLTTDFNGKYGIDPFVKNVSNFDNVKLKKVGLGMEKLPYYNSFFDVVTMLAVFEHLEYDNLPNILSEVKRVLKKDGTFIITTPSPWSDKILHLLARTSLISSEEIHDHKHNLAKSKIDKFLLDAGFEKQKLKSGYFEAGFNMWFAVRK